VREFIQQIRSRHSEVADVLAQSEKIALAAKRRLSRLFHEHMDESERACELFGDEIHGVAWYIDGKLDFGPVSRRFR